MQRFQMQSNVDDFLVDDVVEYEGTVPQTMTDLVTAGYAVKVTADEAREAEATGRLRRPGVDDETTSADGVAAAAVTEPVTGEDATPSRATGATKRK